MYMYIYIHIYLQVFNIISYTYSLFSNHLPEGCRRRPKRVGGVSYISKQLSVCCSAVIGINIVS